MSASDNLVIYPIPSLVATLLHQERQKGSPLTEAEVLSVRDNCPSVAMTRDDAERIDLNRGYKDIDPERCWEEWSQVRSQFSEEK